MANNQQRKSPAPPEGREIWEMHTYGDNLCPKFPISELTPILNNVCKILHKKMC